MSELAHTRNFGIVAHIDSGKTTVSERILIHTKKTYKIGDVSQGTATMDYLDEERERGITITSAATQCHWKGYRLNLIDTPGHVDFTAEVERSLRVLDGAVVVFCGVAGVQPQSETVWRQANRYGVPRVAFINKLDRMGANFYRSAGTIRERLKANPVLMQIPVGVEKEFNSLIDLVEGKMVTYLDEEGKNVDIGPVPPEYQQKFKEGQEKILDAVAEYDDDLMHAFFAGKTIDPARLKAAVRKATLAVKITPVFTGTAIKTKGVDLLLDAICDYLPAPDDNPVVKGFDFKTKEPITHPVSPEAPLCAMAFKTIADRNGDLTFIRIYAGTFNKGDELFNSTQRKTERVGRLFLMHANLREPVERARAGDIVAAIGFKDTVTGDTLCSRDKPILLNAMLFPETVISQSIAPKSRTDRDRLTDALSKLCREDPTFKRHTDPETEETIIAGMGELHLEVKTHTLERDMGIPILTGKPRVAYKQTLAKEVNIEARHIKQTGGRGQYGVVKIAFSRQTETMDMQFVDEIKSGAVPREYIPAVEYGLQNEASRGGQLKFPFVNLKAVLFDGNYHDVDSSEQAFQTAGELALRMAVEQAGVTILEPIMKIGVEVPEEYLGDVLGDMNSRRSEIQEISPDPGIKSILGKVPISTMFSYSTVLRSITQGRGTFSMEPLEYAPLPRSLAEEVIKDRMKQLEERAKAK